MSKLNIAIVGATGLVGRTILKVLTERQFPYNNIKLLASNKSAGKVIEFAEKELIIEELTDDSFNDIDLALFSAGSFVSEHFVPIAVQKGCQVIDNGSFWRMNNDVPLIVPEVNANDINQNKGIITNPNCSTIQLVIALQPLTKYNIKRLVISTYQAVSGGGQKLLDKYHKEMNDKLNNNKYQIFNNIMFHSEFNNKGQTIEEEKMINETRKILNIPDLPINVNCVRIPVKNSHCEFVNIEFYDEINIEKIKNDLKKASGVILVDNNIDYPTPLMSNDSDNVFIGRIRQDESCKNAINMWIVADNTRKGAATNAVQIAELLIKNNKTKLRK